MADKLREILWLSCLLMGCASSKSASTPDNGRDGEVSPCEADDVGGGGDETTPRGDDAIEGEPEAPEYTAFEFDEESSLGFSAEEAASTFGRAYEATFDYVSLGSAEVQVTVTPTYGDLRDYCAGFREGVKTAVGRSTQYGIEGLLFGVEVRLDTSDGMFVRETGPGCLLVLDMAEAYIDLGRGATVGEGTSTAEYPSEWLILRMSFHADGSSSGLVFQRFRDEQGNLTEEEVGNWGDEFDDFCPLTEF